MARVERGRHLTVLAMYTSSRAKADRREHLFQQIARTSDKRAPEAIFLFARAFADAHQLGARIALAEDAVRARRTDRAQAAQFDDMPRQ